MCGIEARKKVWITDLTDYGITQIFVFSTCYVFLTSKKISEILKSA
jgi:hypothetical protein